MEFSGNEVVVRWYNYNGNSACIYNTLKEAVDAIANRGVDSHDGKIILEYPKNISELSFILNDIALDNSAYTGEY